MRLPSGITLREAKVGILEIGPLHNFLKKEAKGRFWVRKNHEQYGIRTPPSSRRVSGQLDDDRYESITEANDPALVFNLQLENFESPSIVV